MTTTDLATTSATSALAIGAGQEFWNDKQLAALRQLGVENASNGDLAVFWHQCVRTGLDPFAKQIHMVARQGKWTIQTGIDGFRLIARRAVDRTGETLGFGATEWCGRDGVWRDVWLETEPPAAARVTVLRNGQPYPAVALYSEYVGTKGDGSVNSMWKSKPAHMLAKCAEALACRRAFPQDLSGIYTADEMQRVDVVQGEVVQNGEDYGPTDLDVALAAVEAAETVGQIRAVWEQNVKGLGVQARARLSAAMTARKDELEAKSAESGDGIVEGEIVEEQPGDFTGDPSTASEGPDEPASPVEAGANWPDVNDVNRRPASRGQLQSLAVKFSGVGVGSGAKDRDKALAVCSFITEREIRTRSDLTSAECEQVADALKECIDAASDADGRAAAFASLLAMAEEGKQ